MNEQSPGPKPQPLQLPSPANQRRDQRKTNVIEHLQKVPIIEIACEKTGIGRATFYRWRKDDMEFAEAVEHALNDGSQLVSDMAESKLISAIKEENLSAIMFWLKHHHQRYSTRVEVINRNGNQVEKQNPEQEALLQQALQLAQLVPDEGKKNITNPNQDGHSNNK